MTSLQKLTEEEVLLVEIRNNIKAQVLCGRHYDKLLRKFSFFQRNCSDPYKIHKKKVMWRLSEITMEMWRHDAKFIPGMMICKHCQQKISNEMLEIGSHGFWLVSMVFQGGFMVFHGFWLVSMIF